MQCRQIETNAAGDLLVAKSSNTSGKNHKVSILKIKAIGKVAYVNDNFKYVVDWFSQSAKIFQGTTYRDTITKLKNNETVRRYAMNEYSKVPASEIDLEGELASQVQRDSIINLIRR